MRVGWFEDYPAYVGGAELTAREFRAAAPDGVQIRLCSQDHVERNVDVYVIQNCTQVDARIIPYLEDKPTLKYVHDLWPHGDRELRNWLLFNAHLAFTSPLHQASFSPRPKPSPNIPPAISLGAYRAAAENASHRDGTAWVGRIHPSKGLKNVVHWAEEKREVVYAYGSGRRSLPASAWLRYMGEVSQGEVPNVLTRYQRFIHLPLALEPLGRSVLEAWAAGCELVVNEKVGATHWFEHPEAVESAASDFWDLVDGCRA